MDGMSFTDWIVFAIIMFLASPLVPMIGQWVDQRWPAKSEEWPDLDDVLS